MKRPAFIALLAGAALWPLTPSAQQGERVRRIGVLLPLPPGILAGFFDELGRLGFVEGRNLTVDRRGFSTPYEQYPAIATELAAAKVDAILCAGEAAIRATQAATQTIPILAVADDMVGAGVVASLARPVGNTTGISILAGDLDGKRQEREHKGGQAKEASHHGASAPFFPPRRLRIRTRRLACASQRC